MRGNATARQGIWGRRAVEDGPNLAANAVYGTVIARDKVWIYPASHNNEGIGRGSEYSLRLRSHFLDIWEAELEVGDLGSCSCQVLSSTSSLADNSIEDGRMN